MTEISNILNEAIQAFDDVKNPLRMLPDQRETWHRFREPVTLDRAYALVREAATADGARRDLGAGALDKLAVEYDRASGQVFALKTEQRGGRVVPASDPMPLRRTAFRQLAARAGAPADYLAKIPARLARACLQHGLVTSGADRDGLIRFAGREARAIVSARYSPIDDARMIETLDNALSRLGLRNEVRVRDVGTGPTTVLRITLPGQAKPVKAGDVIEYGFDVGNGEIGNRALMVDPLAFRIVCTNGVRGWASAGAKRRLRHVGDPERLAEAFNDAIPAAIADASGQVDAMRRATERIVSDVGAEFSLLSERFDLTKAEERDVARVVMAERKLALPEKPEAWGPVLSSVTDLSVYDVLNGITAYAQQKGTDRRLEIEEAAGAYLARRAA